ncbi:MAG: LysM peptidoglycan-binding domain-containing protein [Chloroflexota bacterium]|nr:LysM peptidoglycan-binding domain-containing protein [Chloroflexota bacterium]
MNCNMRRLAVILALLLIIASLLAACQRDRPEVEEEGWTVSPLPETTNTPIVEKGTPLPETVVTTVSVDGSQPVVEPVTGLESEITPVVNTPIPLPTNTPVGAVGTIIDSGPTFEYLVQGGDTLFSIALAQDTDIETIRRLNNLADHTIHSGQVLIVPGLGNSGDSSGQAGAGAEVFVYTVASGDTLSSIAEQFAVDWRDVASANDIGGPNFTIFRGQNLEIPGVVPTAIPRSALNLHVVLPGESLYAIAIQYGVTLQDLMAANQITNPDLIQRGQEIIIPD